MDEDRNASIQLRIIHGAMLGGTLLLLAVALFLARSGGDVSPSGGGASSSAASPVFRWGWLAFATVAVFGAGVLRGRLGRSPDEARVRVTGILIWALAEATAMFGIVATTVSGDLAPALGAALVGVFLMVHHRPSRLG